MCLITFAYHVHPKYKFILAANRDEFYERPTLPANWWEDHPKILGGRDLEANGTWMGIQKNGRFAAVTNYRDLSRIRTDAKTRGELPTNFLAGRAAPHEYAHQVFEDRESYNGFNLLVLDEDLSYVSNYESESFDLNFGLYGLSNALLDTPWQKVVKAKSALNALIQSDFGMEDLIAIMTDRKAAPDESLPSTGLDYEREKALSSMFINTPNYGTCCSTALRIDYDGNVEFMEKSYPVGDRVEQEVIFNFKIEKQ